MSTISPTTLTADQFFEWFQRPENRDRHVELQRGEIVEMPPPGKYHGFVCGNIAGILRNYAIQRKKGYVCTNDSGIIIERDPDTVRGPDVTYYEDAQTAGDMDRGFSERPPRLAVEVLSPHDRINQTVRRVTELLTLGVQMVWVVDPEARDVSVCRSGQNPRLIEGSGELTGDDVLEGFRCSISELFTVPGQVSQKA